MREHNILGLISIVIVLLAIAGLLTYVASPTHNTVSVASFEECVAMGYPVMESYPRKCRTLEGQTFTESVSTTAMPSAGSSGDSTANEGPSCVRAGCFRELCVEASDVARISTAGCEYVPQFACFDAFSSCERLRTGKCGWTDSHEMDRCLAQPEYAKQVLGNTPRSN